MRQRYGWEGVVLPALLSVVLLGLFSGCSRSSVGNGRRAVPSVPPGVGPFLLADLDGDGRAELIWTAAKRCGVAEVRVINGQPPDRVRGAECASRWQSQLSDTPVALAEREGRGGKGIEGKEGTERGGKGIEGDRRRAEEQRSRGAEEQGNSGTLGTLGTLGTPEVILATPHALWTLRAGGGNVAASGGNVAASVPYTLVETPTKVTLKSIIAAPWGADGAEEILALTDSADGTARRPFLTALALFSPRTDGTFQLRWQGFPAKWQPWRIMACDADADGQPDVALGVRKTARYDPHLDNRPFIYSWNGETLLPKWRGSRLSRPFTDFALGDLDGDGADELVAIERTKGKEGREGEGRGGKGREGERGREGNMETRDSGTLGTSGTSGEAEYALRGYEWNGFGYTAAWDSPSYSALRDLHGADLNHDGTTEVLALVTTQEREGVVVFGVRGESLAPLWSSPLGPPLTGLAWGDVDGDGPVEIVAATPTAWRVWQPGL